MKSSDLQIGIIGSGGRGTLLGQLAHRPGRGSRIVACSDVHPGTLERNRSEYGTGLFTTTDYHELLARDLDAVIVATPDFTHEEHAVAVLATGRTLFLEKPMALTIAGCDRILRAAARTKARLYVGHNMRHMPFVRKMKQLIDAKDRARRGYFARNNLVKKIFDVEEDLVNAILLNADQLSENNPGN